MTREEAITELKRSVALTYFDSLTGETSEWLNEENQRYVDACKLAIEALEQESQTKNEKIYCDRNLCFNYECSTCPVNSSQN